MMEQDAVHIGYEADVTARGPEPVTAADDFKIDYRAAARDALN